MLKSIFIGKPIHWVVLAAILGVLKWAGDLRLHVVHFNMFILSVLLGSALLVIFILLTTRPDETLTREDGVADEQ